MSNTYSTRLKDLDNLLDGNTTARDLYMLQQAHMASQMQSSVYNNASLLASQQQYSNPYTNTLLQGILGQTHNNGVNVPRPVPTEEEIENQWFSNAKGESLKVDLMVLRVYLHQHGIEFRYAMSMPSSLVKKMAKAFNKLEVGNLDSELIMALMEEE